MEIRRGYESVVRRDAWNYGMGLALRCLGREVTVQGVSYRIDSPTIFTKDTPSGRIAELLWDILANDVSGMAMLDALGTASEEAEKERPMSLREYANSKYVGKLETGLREEVQCWALAKDGKG